MGGTRLQFCLHVCVLSFLGCVLAGAGKSDDQRYSTITSPERYKKPRPEIRDRDFIHRPHPVLLAPPHLILPMFRHHSAPAVSKELFTPGAGMKVLPSILSNILIPQGREPDIRGSSVSNNHGVEVRCGYSKITVKINQTRLGFRSCATHFRLGTCPVSGVNGSILYFRYNPNDCGSLLSVINGQLLCTNKVMYTPESQGAVIRAAALMLPIQCVYDRFHYSYKIGYLPELRLQLFRKTMVGRNVFSVTVCNERWEELGVNDGYVLGEPMYIEVSTGIMSKDESVYVEACHVTASEDSNSTQRYDVISNFGCMVDSKRTGSQSHYILRQMNVLRFALDAFLFAEAASERFYLHCTVLVGTASASATAKSCTYIESERRWEELDGDVSLCNCCDWECRPAVCNASCGERTVVTSKPIFPEISDWQKSMSGSILLPSHPEGEESQEEEVLRPEEELAEQVLNGVEMNDEGMEDVDAVNEVEDGDEVKEEEPVATDEVQRDEGALQKNTTDPVAKFSALALKGSGSVYISAAEMDSSFTGDVSEIRKVE